MDTKFKGIISHLSDKGFGFVVAETGKSLFFHASSCKGVEFSQLYKGEEVLFSKVEENDKGFNAKCIELR